MTQSQKSFTSLKSLTSCLGEYHSVDEGLIVVQKDDTFLYYGKSPFGWSFLAAASFDVTKEKEQTHE